MLFPNKKIILLIVVLCTLVLTLVLIYFKIHNQSKLAFVSFLDIGQGDAIFIQTPVSKEILIDAGANGSVLRSLNEMIGFWDRDLDIVIATHSDADHIGGLPDIFTRYQVDLFVSTNAYSQSNLFKALEQEIENKNIKNLKLTSQAVIDFGDGSKLIIIYPWGSVRSLDSNEGSLVSIYSVGQIDFLLTGDLPKTVEVELVRRFPNLIDVEVLKVGHHGSKTSSSEEFIRKISPEVCTISVGKNNHYGHPDQSVLGILQKFNCRIFRTDLLGSITLVTDGNNYWQK